MTGRAYDVILKVANATSFTAGNNIIGVNSNSIGIIANVDHISNNIKVKVSNSIQDFLVSESAYSTYIATTGGSANINVQPYISTVFSSSIETANSTILAIYPSPYIAAKNAFSQQPLVRLYSVYFPGEWYPSNEAGNPTGGGTGWSWPCNFPHRFAEIRGDYISDLNYSVIYDGKEYKPYPLDSSAISIDSSGKINEASIAISNFDNLISTIVENPFLVGNNTANAESAIVNGEYVSNIDPRTIPGNSLYDQDIVNARGGYNVAFDYDSTIEVNGTWAKAKIDTRDLLGAVVEIKSTFANFLDVWPEYSTIIDTYSNIVQMRSTLVYRVGDKVTNLQDSYSVKFAGGTENFVSLPYQVLNGKTEFTIETWARFDNFDSTADTILSGANPGEFNEFVILSDPSTGNITVTAQGNSKTFVSGSAFSPGDWKHIAITYNVTSTNIQVLLDGSIINTQAYVGLAPLYLDTNGLFLGQEQDSLGGGFTVDQALHGTLDDIRIWDHVRTPEQINTYMNIELVGTEIGLVEYWKFNEGNGTIAYNSTSSGYNATLSNITWGTSASSLNQFTIEQIEGDNLYLDSPAIQHIYFKGDPLYIVNPDKDPDSYVLDTFKINALESLNEQVGVFGLTSWLQYFKLRLPKRKFYKNTCAWIYKGNECQYPENGTDIVPNTNKSANGFFDVNNQPVGSAELDVCSHNYNGCVLRNNSVHFGGFIGTGRSIPRQ